MKTAYRVDVFLSRDGELHRVRRIEVTCREEAVSTAKAMVPTMAGAFAYQLVSDGTGKAWTISGVVKVGDVPDGYAAELFGTDYLTEAP